MASAPPLPSSSRFQSSDALLAQLAAVLPKGHTFGVYHISTPPTRTEALFRAPAGRRPDRTYCESHFLAITIDAAAEESTRVIAFALEVFVFTTAFSSTFFVSKADSSGYLHLLGLPAGAPSPIRAVSSAFLAYLVAQRRRAGVPSVVSLFARAQSQYLFPGSVDNQGKHVLDDRGLVKWWCRVLDPLLAADSWPGPPSAARAPWKSIRGYLIVPGLDQYETRASLPRSPASREHWTLGHPLEKISHYVQEWQAATAAATDDAQPARPPPRCLIPRYPDDPKARYLDELDDEAERALGKSKHLAVADGSGRGGSGKGESASDGMWKTIKTLDQFWEMMAFRQECSSGRLTGFIWVVFEPGETTAGPAAESVQDKDIQDNEEQAGQNSKSRKKKKTKALRGIIVTRRPRVKTDLSQTLPQQHSYLAQLPASTAYYVWPPEGRGRLLVDEADYKRIHELLLQLDFSKLDKAATSTRRWIQEAGVGSDGWRLEVTGQHEAEATAASAHHGNGTGAKNGTTTSSDRNGAGPVANDPSGLVKRKRERDDSSGGGGAAVNVLQAGLVRKKRKEVGGATENIGQGASAPAVNVLSAGLVRKKPKPA